jgi:hypothetical protein
VVNPQPLHEGVGVCIQQVVDQIRGLGSIEKGVGLRLLDVIATGAYFVGDILREGADDVV